MIFHMIETFIILIMTRLAQKYILISYSHHLIIAQKIMTLEIVKQLATIQDMNLQMNMQLILIQQKI